VIELANVAARGAAGKGHGAANLRGVTLRWERGVLAVIGTPGDGTSALLGVVAGAVRARAGRVSVGGQAPELARALVAYVPLDAVLPDALRVDEVCDLAAEVRPGEPRKPAGERLAPLGLEAMARRRVSSLSPAEARAVSLAIALSLANAKVLLVEEPLAWLEPSAPPRVIEALRARASEGAAVIVTTASVRDATRLGDELMLMTGGALAALPPGLAHAGPAGARLRVVVAGAEHAPLVGALAAEAGVDAIDTRSYAAGSGGTRAATAIAVAGPDLLALARAVNRAIATTRTPVEAIESAVMPLDALRAALAAPRGPALPSVPPPANAQAYAPASSAAPPGGARSGVPAPASPPLLGALPGADEPPFPQRADAPAAVGPNETPPPETPASKGEPS
jgi:ABC-type cobalamin/Fe3+-siderophores transport system ATPase subunit